MRPLVSGHGQGMTGSSTRFLRGGLRALCSGVGGAEQVAESLPPKQRPPPSPLMLRPVVDHVASLAEGREVGVCIVRGVVIPVRRGQHQPGSDGRGRGCRSPTRSGSACPTHHAIGQHQHPTSDHLRGDKPSARAAVRSPHSSPSPGRTGSRPRAVPSRWGRRSGARAGSAWRAHGATCREESVSIAHAVGSPLQCGECVRAAPNLVWRLRRSPSAPAER